jgi:hypothetical protein
MPCEIQQHRDDAHRLLRVVAAVSRANRARPTRTAARRKVPNRRLDRRHPHEQSTTRSAPRQQRQREAGEPATCTIADDGLAEAIRHQTIADAAEPSTDRCADQPADQRMRTGARRYAGEPGHDVPRRSRRSPAPQRSTCGRRRSSALDDAPADRLRDVQAEEQEGDEVEEGRPEHRVLRPPARASRRSSRSSSPRRAGRSGSRTAAQRRSGRARSAKLARVHRRPRRSDVSRARCR